jgi:eukaryotic-like serine/threonine-protein kinase
MPTVQAALAGRYELERELGHGATAVVYLARATDGGRVALKVLRAELMASVAAARFLREIRLAGQLSHPGLARLVDAGQAGWILYCATEFVPGPSLRDLIHQQGPLSPEHAVGLARAVLDALAHAHQRGIVHRDVKPENLILAPHGPVLLDFGIARALDAAAGDDVTAQGIAVGTLDYMSPEQVRGERVPDPRTDLYAMGAVLFECLAGHPPFHPATDVELLRHHLATPAPDLRSFRPGTPAAVAEAVARALAKRQEDRWPDAAAMREALAG